MGDFLFNCCLMNWLSVFVFFLPGPQVMLLHVQYSPEYSRGTFCVYAEFSLPLCASLSFPVLSAMNARYFDLTPQLQFSTPIPYQTYLCHRVQALSR